MCVMCNAPFFLFFQVIFLWQQHIYKFVKSIMKKRKNKFIIHSRVRERLDLEISNIYDQR